MDRNIRLIININIMDRNNKLCSDYHGHYANILDHDLL